MNVASITKRCARLFGGGDALRRQVLWYLKAWSREDGSGWGAVLLRDVDADRDRLTLVGDAVTPPIGCGR